MIRVFVVGAGVGVGATMTAWQLGYYMAMFHNEEVYLALNIMAGERMFFVSDKRFVKTKKEGVYRLKRTKFYVSRIKQSDKVGEVGKEKGMHIYDLGDVGGDLPNNLTEMDKIIVVGSLLPWKRACLDEIADKLAGRENRGKVIWVVSGGDKELRSFEKKHKLSCIKQPALQSVIKITETNQKFLYLLSKSFNNISHK